MQKGIPMTFAAIELARTEKAVYLYGRGSIQAKVFNICMRCGRKLTHPVSILAGIGPECGGHYWNWDSVGGYTEENLAKLQEHIENIKIDTWLPLYCIQDTKEKCSEIIDPPTNHPILKQKENITTKREADLTQDKVTGANLIKVSFPYCFNTLMTIKGFSGRKYVSEGSGAKYWLVPLDYAGNLQNMDFKFTPELQQFLAKKEIVKEELATIPENNQTAIIGLKGTPYPYQLEGIWKMHKLQGNVLLADDMGLGKTLQALGFLHLNQEKRPAIILMPASVKFNWLAECEKWLPFPKAQILSGTNTSIPITGEIILINYDIVSYWVDKLIAIKPKILILDECQYIMNNSAKRTKAVKKLAKNIPHKIPMSGTPMESRPVQLFNSLNMVAPDKFPSLFSFGKRYCAAKHNGYGWDFSGASHMDELHRILRDENIMIRRLKKDVLKDLPEKVLSYIPMQLTNHKEYKQAHNDLIDYLTETKGREAAIRASKAEQLAQIEVLKGIASKGKLTDCIEIVREAIENGKKFAIFANHSFVIDAFMKAFPEISIKIDGSVPTNKRHEIATEFQTNDNIKLFVGNIKAAGVGITLTAADMMMVVELPWTPGALKQVIDRLYRIGQKFNVNILIPLVIGTIEERIAKILQEKEKIATAILDGQEEVVIGNILDELIDSLLNE